MFASGRNQAFWDRTESVTHRSTELYDYSDTDEEAEENNANDDLMKMIEGDWN